MPKAVRWLRHRCWHRFGTGMAPLHSVSSNAPDASRRSTPSDSRRPIAARVAEREIPPSGFNLKSSRFPRLVTRWPPLIRLTTAASIRSRSLEPTSTEISSVSSVVVSAYPVVTAPLPSTVLSTTCRNVASSRRSRRIPENMLEPRKLCKGCPSGAGIPNLVSVPARRIARTTRGLSKKTCEPRMQRGTS